MSVTARLGSTKLWGKSVSSLQKKHQQQGNELLLRLLRRCKSTVPSPSATIIDQIHSRAIDNANNFDNSYNYTHEPLTVHSSFRRLQTPMRPQLTTSNNNNNHVPDHINPPPYAKDGQVPFPPSSHEIQDAAGLDALKDSARLARSILDRTCALAKPGISTDEINGMVHQMIIEEGAYPSPLNYAGFPKSVCSSINEVICHGIPDGYKLKRGDVASFDVSLFFNGYHGDNCGTVLVGDVVVDDDEHDDDDGTEEEHDASFQTKDEELLFITGRRLIQASQEALDMAVQTCRKGSCLTDIGAAVSAVADAYGYDWVEKYKGHGIGRHFHCPPFVAHYRNDEYFELQEGMVFTIEPMITESIADCVEWSSDGWTVVTKNGGRASQFEHMITIKSDGAEILTLPPSLT